MSTVTPSPLRTLRGASPVTGTRRVRAFGPMTKHCATARYLSGQFSCPIRFRLRCGAWDRLWWASLLSSLPFKSRRPAEHEREPSERIRRETQEAIAIGTHGPELLVAGNRPDRDTGRR